MKENPPSESAVEAVRKLSLGPSAQSPGAQGFHINLLANSLTSKLKQQKMDLLNVQRALCHGGRRRDSRRPSMMTKSILSRQCKKDPEYKEEKDLVPLIPRDNDRIEGKPPSSRGSSSVQRRPRIDSAASDRVLKRTATGHKSSVSSRRTNSAGESSRRSMTSMSEIGGRASGATSSVFSFESRGGGRSVQVIKRDGVFQPLDKYAPGRQVLREASSSRPGACDYELYVLPLCEDSALPQGYASPRGYDDMGKKLLKVSWGKTPHENNDNANDDEEEQRQREATPFTPLSSKRPVSEDTFAFRKPVFSSGRSRISGVGLMWEMPTEVPALKPVVKDDEEKKPMWSWLVMHEGRQKSHAKNRGSGHTRPFASNPGPPLRKTTSSIDVRTQHSRDIHPVSTALDREGTSVTKTKWQVPSSSESTLEAERSIMGRLELVKRPGTQLLFEGSTHAFSNSFALGVGSNNLPVKLKESSEPLKETLEEEEQEGVTKSRKSNTDMDTVYSDSRQGDQLSSPTKSRSTHVD